MSDPASVPLRRKSNKKVSIYDIARIADVSPGTVSRVLNNRDRVRDDTRSRILDLAFKLGLKPQVGIRRPKVALVTESSFQDRTGGYAASMLNHVAFALTKLGIDVVQPMESTEELTAHFIDGIVAITFAVRLEKMLEEMEKRVPVVYTDKFDLTSNQFAIRSDHEKAGYLAALHFIERGRKNLAYFGKNTPPYRERLRGFVRALEEAGRPVRENLFVLCNEGESAYVGINHAVRLGADSIYVPGTSMQAVEALHILQYVMRLRIPDDVAIIGGENEGISPYLIPPLTTIAEPLQNIAEEAAQCMQKLIHNKAVPQRVVTLPVRLVDRVSGG